MSKKQNALKAVSGLVSKVYKPMYLDNVQLLTKHSLSKLIKKVSKGKILETLTFLRNINITIFRVSGYQIRLTVQQIEHRMNDETLIVIRDSVLDHVNDLKIHLTNLEPQFVVTFIEQFATLENRSMGEQWTTSKSIDCFCYTYK